MNPKVRETEAAQVGPQSSAFAEVVEEHARAWVDRQLIEEPTADERALLEAALLTPLRAFLARPGKLFRARMVETAFEAGGGDPACMPKALPVVVEAIHAGSLIVDDIQDDSLERRGLPCLHRSIGVPLAINTGNLLYCFALDLIGELALDERAQLALHRETTRALLRGHQGQGLDLTARAWEMERSSLRRLVACSTRLKAGSLLELAAHLGAIASDATEPVRLGLGDFGRELGVGLQMLDDVSGLFRLERRIKAREDLTMGRPTWAWAMLAESLGPEAFQRIQLEAGHVSAGADPEICLGLMAQALTPLAQARIHKHLRAALAGLRGLIGTPPAYLAIEAEVDRLESSFL